jgi:hypothetical protein
MIDLRLPGPSRFPGVPLGVLSGSVQLLTALPRNMIIIAAFCKDVNSIFDIIKAIWLDFDPAIPRSEPLSIAVSSKAFCVDRGAFEVQDLRGCLSLRYGSCFGGQRLESVCCAQGFHLDGYWRGDEADVATLVVLGTAQ